MYHYYNMQQINHIHIIIITLLSDDYNYHSVMRNWIPNWTFIPVVDYRSSVTDTKF